MDWTQTTCDHCQFPCAGDNEPLLTAAYKALTELSNKIDQYDELWDGLKADLTASRVFVFVIRHKRTNTGKDNWWISTSRVRASDVPKLGKTVFFSKTAAYQQMRRLQKDGYR